MASMPPSRLMWPPDSMAISHLIHARTIQLASIAPRIQCILWMDGIRTEKITIDGWLSSRHQLFSMDISPNHEWFCAGSMSWEAWCLFLLCVGSCVALSFLALLIMSGVRVLLEVRSLAVVVIPSQSFVWLQMKSTYGTLDGCYYVLNWRNVFHGLGNFVHILENNEMVTWPNNTLACITRGVPV
jgi:hypothetical protein